MIARHSPGSWLLAALLTVQLASSANGAPKAPAGTPPSSSPALDAAADALAAGQVDQARKFTASPFDFAGGMPLTVSSSSFIGNQALGGDGASGQSGGDGLGGGIFNDAGSASPVNLSNCMLSGNQAAGGAGASGGNGFGGGLYNDGTSTLAVSGSTVTANQATGGQGSPDGVGYGGGFYIDLDAFLSLDADTLLHTENNEPNDISGLYELFP